VSQEITPSLSDIYLSIRLGTFVKQNHECEFAQNESLDLTYGFYGRFLVQKKRFTELLMIDAYFGYVM